VGGSASISGNTIAGVMGSVILENGFTTSVEAIAGLMAFRPQQGGGGAYQGSIADYYGLLLDDSTQDGVGVYISNHWGVYQKGATVKNKFEGLIIAEEGIEVPDTANGNRYKITVTNGVITAVQV
jgi:hypothetical protein